MSFVRFEIAMATTKYEMKAMIHGYHVYATVWDAQTAAAQYVPFSTSSSLFVLWT